jgi:hypothetical protein
VSKNTVKYHQCRQTPFPVWGTKNLTAESLLSTRHLRFEFEGANFIRPAPLVTRLFSQSLPPPRGRLLQSYQLTSSVQEFFEKIFDAVYLKKSGFCSGFNKFCPLQRGGAKAQRFRHE